MQFPTQGQWWSKRATHLLQLEQCLERIGLLNKQQLQKCCGSKPGPNSANCLMVCFKIKPITISDNFLLT